jgi:hypothetical protein
MTLCNRDVYVERAAELSTGIVTVFRKGIGETSFTRPLSVLALTDEVIE